MVNSKGYSAVHYAAYHGNKQNLELVREPCLLIYFSSSFVEFWGSRFIRFGVLAEFFALF